MKSIRYKKGEKFVCIDNTSRYTGVELGYTSLTLLKIGGIYTFHDINSYGEMNFLELLGYSFRKQRFVKYSELRKVKLEKLNTINI